MPHARRRSQQADYPIYFLEPLSLKAWAYAVPVAGTFAVLSCFGFFFSRLLFCSLLIFRFLRHAAPSARLRHWRTLVGRRQQLKSCTAKWLRNGPTRRQCPLWAKADIQAPLTAPQLADCPFGPLCGSQNVLRLGNMLP